MIKHFLVLTSSLSRYRKVTSRSRSWLVLHSRIFNLSSLASSLFKRMFIIVNCTGRIKTFAGTFFLKILFWRQIKFKREEARLPSSLLNINCCQIWYQSKSDYIDRAIDQVEGVMFLKKFFDFDAFQSFFYQSTMPLHKFQLLPGS